MSRPTSELGMRIARFRSADARCVARARRASSTRRGGVAFRIGPLRAQRRRVAPSDAPSSPRPPSSIPLTRPRPAPPPPCPTAPPRTLTRAPASSPRSGGTTRRPARAPGARAARPPPLAPAVAPPQPSAPPSRPPDAGSGRAGKPTASERVAARVAEENAGASLERALLDLERMAEGNPDLQEALASIQRGPRRHRRRLPAPRGGDAPRAVRRGGENRRQARRPRPPEARRAVPDEAPPTRRRAVPLEGEAEAEAFAFAIRAGAIPLEAFAIIPLEASFASRRVRSVPEPGFFRRVLGRGVRKIPRRAPGGDAAPGAASRRRRVPRARPRPVRLEDRPDWDPSPAKSPARARSRSGSPGRATRKSWPPPGDPLAAHGDWPPGARATPPRKSSPSRGGRSGRRRKPRGIVARRARSPRRRLPGAWVRRFGDFFGSSLADRVPTVSAYVDRHADPAARAFAGFAGASGRAERDAALGWLRRFCGDDAAPPAEMAEILAAMDARARDEGVEDVSFEELREMLGLAGEDGGVPGRNASGVVPVPSAREAERRSAERRAELSRGGDAEPEWQSLRAGRGVPNEARASSDDARASSDDARASSFSLAGPDVPLASPSPSPSRLEPLAPLVDPAVEVLDLGPGLIDPARGARAVGSPLASPPAPEAPDWARTPEEKSAALAAKSDAARWGREPTAEGVSSGGAAARSGLRILPTTRRRSSRARRARRRRGRGLRGLRDRRGDGGPRPRAGGRRARAPSRRWRRRTRRRSRGRRQAPRVLLERRKTTGGKQ